MTYVLDGKEFDGKEHAEKWAHVMAESDALTAFNANDSATKEEIDSYIEILTKCYEKRIKIKRNIASV
jgi:ferritin